MKAHKDCHADLSPAPGVWSNSAVGGIVNDVNQGFMDAYNVMANYVSFMMVNHPVTRDQFPGAYTTSAKARMGIAGWPESMPVAYSGPFVYYTWDDLGESSFGKCRADFIGANNGVSDFGTADANTLIDTSNGQLLQYRVCPVPAQCGASTMYNLLPGDKVKVLQANTSQTGDASELSTGLVAPFTQFGPTELDPSLWYCAVDIDNSTGKFKLAPATGAAPNECSSHGSTITSYSGMVEGGADRTAASAWYTQGQLPSGMTLASSWVQFHFLVFRLQNTDFSPNPTYNWWAVNGVCSIVSAGFSGVAPYCAQGRTYLSTEVPISIVSGSNASFDWNELIVPPRAP